MGPTDLCVERKRALYVHLYQGKPGNRTEKANEKAQGHQHGAP
jgi:hypothetical protein